MEKKTPVVFPIVLFFQIISAGRNDCPKFPDKTLSCYNDYSKNITCFWESPFSDDRGSLCTITSKLKIFDSIYNASCNLKPVIASMPAKQKCSMVFEKTYMFSSYTEVSLNLSCNHHNQNLTYKPSCHIKLHPPTKPNVKSSTVSWSNQVAEHWMIENYKSQLQWKLKHQSWTDLSVQRNTIQKEGQLAEEAKLDSDLLVKGEKYEAHVRVMVNQNDYSGIWSDWSPIESWASSIGRLQTQPEIPVNFIHLMAVGLALFGILMIFIFFKTKEISWIYIVKGITGSPTPNPGKAIVLQTWLNPPFSRESFSSQLKPVKILSVEVTAQVDAVTPYEPDVQMKAGDMDPNSPSFYNPSYSGIRSANVSSLLPGSLEACAFDMSYRPAKNTEEFKVVQQKTDIPDLFFMGGTSGESAVVITDYKAVEKLQCESLRLLSTDSGMGNNEDFSQEKVEGDSINANHYHSEVPDDKEKEEKQPPSKLDFLKLFGGFGDVPSGQSIHVCFDYERLPNQQMYSPELPSVESGVGSVGEEHESQERLDENDQPTETTRFLFPPDSPNILPLPEVFTS